MRKTKIVCTLGPATDSYTTVKRLVSAGMNVARINMSHGSHEEHHKRMELIRRARKELDIPIAILLDTKGPEIRLKTFKAHKVTLEAGKTFTLTPRDIEGDESIVSITYPTLADSLKVGDPILVNDGLIQLQVKELKGGDIICDIINSGEVSDRKSINLPNTSIDMPYISDVDRDDLLFGVEEDVDYIAMSFVRSVADVRQVKRILNEHSANNIQLIAKIENRSGVNSIHEIIAECDGAMVARGDMGVEIPFEELPGIQKDMITMCYRKGKKVITATQMLESMINNPRPTRAEISDVANAIYDGSSAIMLSGETAAGKYPVEAVKTMARIAERVESDINYKKRFNNLEVDIKTITDAVSHSTCAAAFDLNAAAIIAVSQSGYTARKVSRFRPNAPIIAATTSEKAYNQLALNWGVTPTRSVMQSNSDELFAHAVQCAVNTGVVKKGDLVIIVAGVPVGVGSHSNNMRIETI